MRSQQRTDERSANTVGGRPIRRPVLCQPSLPSWQHGRREHASIARDELDSHAFRFEKSVFYEHVGEAHRVFNGPSIPVLIIDATRERPDAGASNVIEAQ